MGCSTPYAIKPDVYHDHRKMSGYEVVRTLEIGSVAKADVGEVMYMKVYRQNHDTYSIKLEQAASGIYGKDYTYNSVALGFDGGSSEVATKNKMAAFFDSELFVLREWPVRKYKTICSIENICLVDIKDDMYFSHKAAYPYKDLIELDMPIKYSLIQTPPDYDSKSFKYVAIYQGRVDDTISVLFREYNEDMVKPAFTQEMNFQLDEEVGKVIEFKGLRIKIIVATDLDITYIVIKDYK